MMAPTPSTSAAGASSVQSSYAQSRGQVPPTTSLLGPLAPFPRPPEPEVIAHGGVQPPGSNGHEYPQPRRPDSPPRARANAQGSHIQAPVGIDGKQSRLVFTTGLFVERKPPYAVGYLLVHAGAVCTRHAGLLLHVAAVFRLVCCAPASFHVAACFHCVLLATTGAGHRRAARCQRDLSGTAWVLEPCCHARRQACAD